MNITRVLRAGNALAALFALAAVPASAQDHAQVVFASQVPAPAAAPTPPTIDQSLSLHSIGNPQISPDGRYVAFEVQRTNWDDNAFERDLWISNTATGERYQLTRSKKSNSSPKWAPDGRAIAFISDRDDKRQIYLISPTGGEARSLTRVETGVESFEWSPDGRRIAFTAEDPESKASKERTEKYGEYRVIEGDYTMTHLWMIELPGESDAKMPEPQRLTEGSAFTVGRFTWAPDGRRIAFDATRDPDLGSENTSEIYVLTLADKSVKKLAATPGPSFGPMWSPDGLQIAYETANGNPYFYYANGLIAVAPAGGGAGRVLTEAFDEDPGLVAWSPEGIYFVALQRTYQHLFRVNPATKAIERITSPEQFLYGQFSFSRDFGRMSFVAAADNQVPEVYVSSLSPFAPQRLTREGDQFKDFKLARREVVEWKSTDGAAIEGILLKPADFDPAKKYPLLVVIHGGPTGVDRAVVSADRYYPMEQFVAKGALILRPNYRGSAGYGAKFRALNVRNLGVGDYADVISGVDYLIGKGWVDPARVGAMGWSEGGYISAFITASSDRFRAVSVGAGISDWVTYYVNTDIHPFTRQYLKATPWDDPEIYRKTSPITYIRKAKTPTLIQQGDKDARVPVPDSFELYQALRDLGVPVKMVLYNGFGHPINKPKQQRAVMEENYNWFRQWIWGEKPAPAEAKPESKAAN